MTELTIQQLLDHLREDTTRESRILRYALQDYLRRRARSASLENGKTNS